MYEAPPAPCGVCGGAMHVRVASGEPRTRSWIKYTTGPDGSRGYENMTEAYTPTEIVPCPVCSRGEDVLEEQAERFGLGRPAVGLEGWQPSGPMEPMRLAVQELLDAQRWCVLMRSGVGSGKTTLARMTGVEAVRRGVPVAFWNVPDLLDAIRHTYDERGQDEAQYDFLQRRLYNRRVLILDDLGAHKPTAWASSMIYEIVDHVYRNRRQQSLIITTNIPPDRDFDPAAGGWLIEERVLSRLRPGEVVVVGAPDRRGEFDR